MTNTLATKLPVIPLGMAAEYEESIDAQIADALLRVNGRATAFTNTKGAQVRDIARQSEEMLEGRGVPQKYRVGSIAVFAPSGPASSSYNHPVISTEIRLLRKRSKEWTLDAVNRVYLYPKTSESLKITISSKAANSIVTRALSSFVVSEDNGESPVDGTGQ